MASWRDFCSKNGEKPWGKTHRLLRKGPTKNEIPKANQRSDGTYTSSAEKAATTLLNHLIPNDPEMLEQETMPINRLQINVCILDELKDSIWKINPKKAPGADNFTALMIRKEWPLIDNIYLEIVNDALTLGTFPDCWKTTEVIPIIKSAELDPAIPKSYQTSVFFPFWEKVWRK